MEVLIGILIIGIVFWIASKNSSAPQYTSDHGIDPKYFEDPKPRYKPGVKKLEVKGVGSYYDREEAFNAVMVGDKVFLEWDADNPVDTDAIGVYTKEDELIGYMGKNNKKLIQAMYHQNIEATVAEKSIENNYYTMYVKVIISDYPE